jgi:hypothetical protein
MCIHRCEHRSFKGLRAQYEVPPYSPQHSVPKKKASKIGSSHNNKNQVSHPYKSRESERQRGRRYQLYTYILLMLLQMF